MDQKFITEQIKTTRPEEMIVPTSKLLKEAFRGDLAPGTGKEVNVQERTKAKKYPVITTIALQIKMENQEVTIKDPKELGAFDLMVYDAVVTLYEGGNKYITDSMVFDTLSGKERATLNPKQKEAISNAVLKLMSSLVRIDATKEAEKFGYDEFVYEGFLLPAERVVASLNGTTVECIHLFRSPPLYDYADARNQIGRLDINLLNSPVRKSVENITLHGILYRRILGIKGKSKLNPTIKYESIYKILKIKALSDGALRKKKSKVRDTVKRILNYWSEEGFIKGYEENKSKKGEIISITITIRY